MLNKRCNQRVYDEIKKIITKTYSINLNDKPLPNKIIITKYNSLIKLINKPQYQDTHQLIFIKSIIELVTKENIQNFSYYKIAETMLKMYWYQKINYNFKQSSTEDLINNKLEHLIKLHFKNEEVRLISFEIITEKNLLDAINEISEYIKKDICLKFNIINNIPINIYIIAENEIILEKSLSNLIKENYNYLNEIINYNFAIIVKTLQKFPNQKFIDIDKPSVKIDTKINYFND